MTPRRRASDDPLAKWGKILGLVALSAGMASGVFAFAWRVATQPLVMEVRELRREGLAYQLAARRQRADLLELARTPSSLVILRAKAIEERWAREDAELERKEP